MIGFHIIKRHLYVNRRRLQNPEIVKQMPTVEQIKNNKFTKSLLVYVCGFGATGSLGLPRYYKPEKKFIEDVKSADVTSTSFKRLRHFCYADKVQDVSCGFGYTVLAGRAEGTSQTAFGFGLNTHSQIGYQAERVGFPLEIVASPSPILLPTNEPIMKVACGRSHTLALDAKNNVFSLGNNSFGQCGRRINPDEIYFGSRIVHHIKDLPKNIKDIECGQDHSFFLAEDGKLFACGWGADGQTGLGHYDNQTSPKQVKGDLEWARIIKISSFADTVLALDNEGNVFGWGNTEYGQFRVLAKTEQEQFNVPKVLKLTKIPGKIVDIAAGGTIMAILNDLGQVFVWGFGILGKGPDVNQSSFPTMIPETLFGKNAYSPDSRVTNIYASLSHFAAITNTGELYTWGKNRGGCLGLNHKQNQYFPLKADTNLAQVKKVGLGIDHTCVIAEKVV